MGMRIVLFTSLNHGPLAPSISRIEKKNATIKRRHRLSYSHGINEKIEELNMRVLIDPHNHTKKI